MAELISILGTVGVSIALTKEFISVIDLVIGCCTKNTPAAVLWSSLLTRLRTETTHAQDQLCSVQDEVEPLRIQQGPGANAANQKRKAVKFDELIQELARQLQASEKVFLAATNKFKQQGRFHLALLEALGTKARDVVKPIESHCQELKTIRLRVHEARQSIINAFLLNCHGGQFPSLESLGVIRHELAKAFLWPKPFCRKFETKDELAPGLLQCNKTDINLNALRGSIQEMGVHWVHAVRASNRRYEGRDAATYGGQRRINAFDVLEECQDKILVQLRGVFKTIMEDGAPFAKNDQDIAMRGLGTLEEWSSICVAAESGIIIAVGGKTSAGKSSILNAMLGQSLLPTGKRACTAVPSRLRHVSGQIEPTLSIPYVEPYMECLDWIKTQDLSSYRDSPRPDHLKQWADFEEKDPSGSAVLAKIKADKCSTIEVDTKGDDALAQMEFLNALVRICRAFGKEVDMGYPKQWPVLSVEFTGLKYHCQNLPGPFMLLDLPGYNENILTDTNRFKDLMDRAARQADVMVPVIGGPTLLQGNKWADHTILSEWRTKISSVIITKRDLVENLDQLERQFVRVAKKCEIPGGRTDCVLSCDTPQGMAAMKLQLFLDEIERKYATNPIPPEATADIDQRLRQETEIIIAGITDELSPFHRLYDQDSEVKDYTAFTFDHWRELVEKRLISSQFRQTCDMFAENTIEEARRLRLARFTEDMKEILDDLVSSLSLTLSLDRASPDELGRTQLQIGETLSDLRLVLNQWAPRIEEVRAKQEGKLDEALLKFERAAKASANEAITLCEASLPLDGDGVLGKGGKADHFIEKCRETVLGRLNHAVNDAIRDLCELWKENQDAVLLLLRDATANIETQPQLAELLKNTIDELEKVKRLDPEKLRIATSGTPGEDVVGATTKRFWHRIRMKPATHTQAPEENKRAGPFSLLKQKFGRSGRPKVVERQSHNVPTIPSPVASSTTSIASPEVSNADGPDTNFAGLAVVMLVVNMAEGLRATVSGLQSSVPTVQEMAQVVKGNPSANEQTNDQGPLKLTPGVLRKYILGTALDPLVSRVKAEAQSSMTDSLIEMGTLARRAALGALEECNKVIEEQLKAQGSKNTAQVQAKTLEHLACWGNLVAAQGVIQEMDRKRDEPVARVTPSRPPSSLLLTSPCSPPLSIRPSSIIN